MLHVTFLRQRNTDFFYSALARVCSNTELHWERRLKWGIGKKKEWALLFFILCIFGGPAINLESKIGQQE